MEKQEKMGQDMKKVKKKNANKGITLIALVITIIVLLILAGVSIATLTGDNGLLTKTNEAKLAVDKARALEAAQLAYSTVMVEHIGQVTEDAIAGLVVNQMQEDGETVVTKTTSTGKITSITINRKTSEAIIVATEGGNQTKTLTVAYENGTSQAGSTYYVLARDVYYMLTVNLTGVSLSENYLSQEELDAIEGNATVDDTITIEPETNSYAQVTLQNTTLTITGASATTSPVAIKLKSTNGGAEATLTITVETPSSGNVQPGAVVTTTVKDNYTDGTNSATVPAGFTVSNIPSEQTISTGLVIYDIPEADIEKGVDWITKNADGAYQVQTKYNQFVWIPVASTDSYERNFSYPSYYDSNKDYTPANSTFTDTSYLPADLQPAEDTATANETAERASVKKYNGFYIARYEAGDSDATSKRTIETDGALVSKQNVWVYNYIKQVDSKTKAKTMYTTGDIRSSLCSGIQWDMVMKFVNGKKDANGNTFNVRTYRSARHSGRVAQTGKDNDDKVQNIYDLEGNCYEWAAEKNNNTSHPFVARGGYYSSYSLSYAGWRTNDTLLPLSDYSFRPALYIM